MTSTYHSDETDLPERIQNARTKAHAVNNDGEQMNELKRLARALVADHEVTQSNDSIEEAIAIYEDVLQRQSSGRELHSETVSDLGDALYRACRYNRADHTRAHRCRSLLREGLQLRPRGHALRSHSLHSLAQALIFVDDDGHVGGSLSAYTESILLSREALQLRPVGHSERAESLSDLACGLLMSFSHNNEPLVLDEALELFRENLKLCPSGHLQRDTSLNRLAVALLYRFQDQGDFATLAELIFMHREVLLLRPVGHPLRYVTFDNLAVAIRTSFSLQGFPELLSDAIALHREAVDMVSKTHPDYARITCNLAEALVRDFKQRGVLSILDESITLLRQALLLLPIGNDAYWVALHRLAKALLARFEVDKNRDHLLESIALHREHLKLGTLGQDYLQDSLGSLGRLLCKPECQSWEEALELFRKSVEICPYGAPARAQLLSDMSLCFLDPKSPFFDFSEGLSLLCEAHSNIFAHVNWRLRMASLDMQRVEAAYKHLMSHNPAPDQTLGFSTRILQLYDRVISLLPRAANFGLDHDARLHAVVGSDQLVRDAVARALSMNHISQAVEILEGGRGLFWTQTLRLRATIFGGVPEEDHKELVRLLNLLDHGASPLNQVKKSTAQRERDMEARRLLNEQVEALITRIRGYPGLDRFLLSPTFLTLLGALPDGFVAIVNASKLGHHALLLNRATGLASNLELKPLQFGFDPRELRTRLPRDTAFYAADETEMSGRGMRLVGRTNDNLYDVLSALWNSIALPVINALQLQSATGRTRPRLWWCVTGELGFLPIHAAGTYQDAHSCCISDYAVSSYIPTLSSLTKARSGWKPIDCTRVAGLVICEDASSHPRVQHLPQAVVEVQVVRECFATSQARVLNTHSAHTSAPELRSILGGTPAHILHLACHAIQALDPLRSALLLQDGELTIQNIIQMNLPHAVLAYLSACQTAKGDCHAPDEAVHLAASMLFCGFRSVVGTMWLMHDEDGPKLARRFYEGLFAKPSLDLDDVPYALDDAIQALRRDGVPAPRWAPFMHLGG